MMFKSFIAAASACVVRATTGQYATDFDELFDGYSFTFQGTKKYSLRTMEINSIAGGFEVLGTSKESVSIRSMNPNFDDTTELPSALFRSKNKICKGDKVNFKRVKVQYSFPRQSSPIWMRGEAPTITDYSDPVRFDCVKVSIKKKNNHFRNVGLVPERELRHSYLFRNIVKNVPASVQVEDPVEFKPELPSRGSEPLPQGPVKPQDPAFSDYFRRLRERMTGVTDGNLEDSTAHLRENAWIKPEEMSELMKGRKHCVAAKAGDSYYRCTVQNQIVGRRHQKYYRTKAYREGLETFGTVNERIDIKWTEPENMPPKARGTTRIPLNDFLVYKFI